MIYNHFDVSRVKNLIRAAIDTEEVFFAVDEAILLAVWLKEIAEEMDPEAHSKFVRWGGQINEQRQRENPSLAAPGTSDQGSPGSGTKE